MWRGKLDSREPDILIGLDYNHYFVRAYWSSQVSARPSWCCSSTRVRRRTTRNWPTSSSRTGPGPSSRFGLWVAEEILFLPVVHKLEIDTRMLEIPLFLLKKNLLLLTTWNARKVNIHKSGLLLLRMFCANAEWRFSCNIDFLFRSTPTSARWLARIAWSATSPRAWSGERGQNLHNLNLQKKIHKFGVK